MTTELWVPGFAGPLNQLVERLHRRIEQFAKEQKVEEAHVEIELADGVRYAVESLAAEPGFGFVTIRPHASDDTPVEVIVPIGAIKRIELSRVAEERGLLGFALPAAGQASD
jgi:hypothetical protein